MWLIKAEMITDCLFLRLVLLEKLRWYSEMHRELTEFWSMVVQTYWSSLLVMQQMGTIGGYSMVLGCYKSTARWP